MVSRRSDKTPARHGKEFTIEEIDYGIKKLRRRLAEVNGLDPAQIEYSDHRVNTIESNIVETIREVFGPKSPEFREHEHHEIWYGPSIMGEDPYTIQQNFAAGIPMTLSMLAGLIKKLEEMKLDIAFDATSQKQTVPAGTTRRILVVHGDDGEAKQTVARFLDKINLEPVIFQEQPDEGKTILEKFEYNKDVAYVVVILTPDDTGYAGTESRRKKDRAGQHTILELGYLIGRLSAKRICVLFKDTVEIPSGNHGVFYVPMDENSAWKQKLAAAIKQTGLSIDMNLVMT
jgi:predicted nucleotide-binding protein